MRVGSLACCVAWVSAGITLLPVSAAETRQADDSTSPKVSRLVRLLDEVAAPPAQPTQPVTTTLMPSEIREVNPEVPPVVLPKPMRKLRLLPEVVTVITGEASWYGPGFFGNRTANGEVYRPGTMTAAHRTLPFGTKVRVTNLANGRTAVIRINDRGPFINHRVIDLGHGAATELGLVASGIAPVKLEVLR